MVISSMAATVSLGVGVRFRVAATERFGVAYRCCTLYAGTISYVGIESDLVLSRRFIVDGPLRAFARFYDVRRGFLFFLGIAALLVIMYIEATRRQLWVLPKPSTAAATGTSPPTAMAALP